MGSDSQLEIKASFLLKNKKRATSAEQKNIFDLTTQLVEGTQCEVNVLLCARVAFMVCGSRQLTSSLSTDLFAAQVVR
jgi:hypothetical protein